MTQSCLIIGAGIAGLLAATSLQNAGLAITVLEKAPTVGGRMANCTLDADQTACADHGAQYFTVQSQRFQSFVDQWLAEGIVSEWAQGFHTSDGRLHDNGVPRYVCHAGMDAVAQQLARSLTVHSDTMVTKLDFQHQFVAHTASGDRFESNLLLLTPPAQQSLALIESGNITISAETRHALNAITFDPCFALMLQLDRASTIPAPGGLWPTNPEPIRWLADNQQKGISAETTITIHAGPTFTKQQQNSSTAQISKRLIAAARPYIGSATIIAQRLVYWPYSIPTVLHSEATLLDTTTAPIAFAGDAFRSARVEGAALSGLAAADALLQASGCAK